MKKNKNNLINLDGQIKENKMNKLSYMNKYISLN